MRRYALLVALLAGCIHHQTPLGVHGAVLGRVVVYRNGVAFYERRATAVDGRLAIHVPRDRVDDFLKSLTVVDAVTHKPLMVSIPRKESGDDGYLTMTLEEPGVPAHHRSDVLLTYITEAPAWKPSYRVVIGPPGKVMLEGWAVVDNVSGENWDHVLVGVGASSALSFRYDLWSVRHVSRDLLQGDERFALAPPTGVSPYATTTGGEEVAELDASEVRGGGRADGRETRYALEGATPTIDPATTTTGVTIDKNYEKSVPTSRTFSAALGTAAGAEADVEDDRAPSRSVQPPRPPPVAQGDAKLRGIATKILRNRQDVVIESHGRSRAEVASRAASVRNTLIDDGVPAARIRVVPRVAPGEGGTIRVLAVAHGAAPAPTAPPAAARAAMPDTPVGESHFMSDRPMTVANGTSAMVAMVHGETSGGIVYLYDPISDRGDDRYAFKAVRLDNPTDDTLEPGPVTVYGDGRFIGEGITEPVPPKAAVVVPFALDRQIVVTHDLADNDRIAKLVTVERGVVTAQVQHRRETHFTITSRLPGPSKVFLRHRLESGWTLVDAPPRSMKVGDSRLFEVDLGPGETRHVTIAEATPVERKLQLSSNEALDLMKVYVDEPEVSPALAGQIRALLATHRQAADLTERIQTLHDQLAEFRAREAELHGQLVTLKAVRTGGELMATLRGELADVSARVQKATLAVVDARDHLMLLRVKFENQLAELHLDDATEHVSSHVSSR